MGSLGAGAGGFEVDRGSLGAGAGGFEVAARSSGAGRFSSFGGVVWAPAPLVAGAPDEGAASFCVDPVETGSIPRLDQSAQPTNPTMRTTRVTTRYRGQRE
jgi:hypothetical protein